MIIVVIKDKEQTVLWQAEFNNSIMSILIEVSTWLLLKRSDAKGEVSHWGMWKITNIRWNYGNRVIKLQGEQFHGKLHNNNNQLGLKVVRFFIML